MKKHTSGNTVHLITLGGAAIELRGPADVTRYDGGKVLALLAYLDGARARAASRDELLDMLWSDKDPTHARNALRQLVYATRRRFGHLALDATEEAIRLGQSVTSDRGTLSDAIDRGDAASVVHLYAGPFLGSFAQPGTRRFEEWAGWERERLRAAFLRATEELVREAHRRGRPAEAVHLARRMRDEDPDREPSWRLLLQTLGAAGDWLAVASEQEALRQFLAAEGRDPEAATVALLRRLPGPQPTRQRQGVGLTLELVGRQTEFASLLALWQRAATGHKSIVDLRGIAGVGKSRLLGELRGRLRAEGARVIGVRARSGERELEWSLLADVVQALGQSAGSAAVDPHVVPDLIALAPALQDRFPHAAASRGVGEETRRRSTATFGLLDAVVQEAPLALLIDDWHWGDEASIWCLQIALERLEPTRSLLCVLGSRPHGREVSGLSVSPVVLAGLSRSDVEMALGNIAALPKTPAASVLVDAVATGSGGVPQEILAVLQDLLKTNTIAIVEEVWEVRDPRACDALAHTGSGTRRVVAALPPTARRVLRMLARAGTPLKRDLLADSLTTPLADVARDLDVLVDHGMITCDGGDCEVAHDLISEAALEGDGDPANDHSALARAWLGRAADDVGALRHAFRHARHNANAELLASVGTTIALLARSRRDPRPLRHIAAELLCLDPRDPVIGRVLRRNSLFRRAGRTRLLWSLVACLAVSVLTWAAWSQEEPSLALVVEPLPTNPLTPAPTVELRGMRGRWAPGVPDSVRVQKVEGPGDLLGPTTRPVLGGRAQFSELGVSQDGRYVLEFFSPGFRSVRTEVLEVGAGLQTQLRIVGGIVGGQAVRPEDPIISVRPGADLSGWLELAYRSPWVAASVTLCAARSWEPAAQGYWTVVPLATPARDLMRRVSLDSAALRAPSAPGVYYLIFAHDAEPACSWIMSLTNWVIGTPRWDDGNELVERAVEQLQLVRSSGKISVQVRRNTIEHGDGGLAPAPIAVAVLSIEVRMP
ncbi:MAG: AAA family ATPase [Gemmatimonadetes bacterium]|nr:AAA family ATPase [Gemmatimonadota bacterium]